MNNISNKENQTKLFNGVVAIILIVLVCAIIPSLPNSITKWLRDPLIILIVFLVIAYLVTNDVVLSFLLAICSLVIYLQVLNMHKNNTPGSIEYSQNYIPSQQDYDYTQNYSQDYNPDLDHNQEHNYSQDLDHNQEQNYSQDLVHNQEQNHSQDLVHNQEQNYSQEQNHSQDHTIQKTQEQKTQEQINNNEELKIKIISIASQILNKDNINEVINNIILANPNIDSKLINDTIVNLYNNMSKNNVKINTNENTNIPSGVPENDFDLNGPVDFDNNILSDSCLNSIPEYNPKTVCDNMVKFDGYEHDNYMTF